MLDTAVFVVDDVRGEGLKSFDDLVSPAHAWCKNSDNLDWPRAAGGAVGGAVGALGGES